MQVLILLCILAVALNVTIYFLCQITYRKEDAVKIAEGKLRVKSETTDLAPSCWMLSALFLMASLFVLDDLGLVEIMVGLICLVAFFLCLYAVFHRNSYYTIDDDRLTHVKKGVEEWSHTWNEIDHARRRVVSTGKSFIIYYDIETKEGVIHRSLPSSLEKELKEHVPMDDGANLTLITLVIIAIIIVGVIVAMKIASNQ